MEATYPKKQLHQQHNHQYHMCRMNSSTPSPHITTSFSTGKSKSSTTPRPVEFGVPLSQHFTSDHGQVVDNGHFSSPMLVTLSKESPVHSQEGDFSWHSHQMMSTAPHYRASMSPKLHQNSPLNNLSPNSHNPHNINNYNNNFNNPYHLTSEGEVQGSMKSDRSVHYRQTPGQLNSPNSSWNSMPNYQEDFSGHKIMGYPFKTSQSSHMGKQFNTHSPSTMNSNIDPNNSTPTLNQLLQAPTFIMQHQSANKSGPIGLGMNDQKFKGQSPKFLNDLPSFQHPPPLMTNNTDFQRDYSHFSPDGGHLAPTQPLPFPYHSLPNSGNSNQNFYSSNNTSLPANHINNINYLHPHSSQYGSNISINQKLMPEGNYRAGPPYDNGNIPRLGNAQNLDSHMRSPLMVNNNNNINKVGMDQNASPNLLNQMLLSSNPSPLSHCPTNYGTPQFGANKTQYYPVSSSSQGARSPAPSPDTNSYGTPRNNRTLSPVDDSGNNSQNQSTTNSPFHPSSIPEENGSTGAKANNKRVYKLKKESGQGSSITGKEPRSRDYKRRKKSSDPNGTLIATTTTTTPSCSIVTQSSSSLATTTSLLINNYNSESNSNLSSLTGGGRAESNASNNSYHQSLNSPAFISNPGSLPNSYPLIGSRNDSIYSQRNESDGNNPSENILASSNGFKNNQSHKNAPTPINLSSYSPDQSSSASFKEENSGNLNSPSWLSKSISSPNNPSESPSLSRIDKLNHNLRVKKNEPIAKLYEFGAEPERKPFLDHLLKFNEQNANPIPFIPTVSKAYVDLYKLYFMVKERGGILMVNQRKLWREIAAEILDGHSASTSYNLRKQYLKCLLDYECKFELNGADPAPIITQIELSVKKKKKKIDNSQVSTVPQNTLLPSSSMTFNSMKTNLSVLNPQGGPQNNLNSQSPFSPSPTINFMQSQNNNNPNPSLNISPSERIKVRDPFSDENPMGANNYGNYKPMIYNNLPSHVSNVGQQFNKINPAQDIRINNEILHSTMQPSYNQFQHKPFVLENSNKINIEQQSFNEYNRTNPYVEHPLMQNEIKSNFMQNSPSNLPPNLDKRLSDHGLRSQVVLDQYPRDAMIPGNSFTPKPDIKCEYIGDQHIMDLQGHAHDFFNKDTDLGHTVPMTPSDVAASFNLPKTKMVTLTHSSIPNQKFDLSQPEFNYRGPRLPSSNLFHDIPPNVAITENSIDPRSLKYSSRNALSSVIIKDPPFPPDSIEALTPKYSKHKKIYFKDLSNFDLRKVQLALKSGLLSLSTHAIDAFSVLQSEESKLSQFQFSQCQGFLDLLIEYFQASLEILFEISLVKKPQHDPVYDKDATELNTGTEDKKEKMRNGKNYTMITRNKKPVHFKPSLNSPNLLKYNFEHQSFDEDNTLLRSFPHFNKCITNFRSHLHQDITVSIDPSNDNSNPEKAKPLGEDSQETEPSLDFAIEENDVVIMYKDAPHLVPIKFAITLANIFRGLSFVPGNEAMLCKNHALLNIVSKLILLRHSHHKSSPYNYDLSTSLSSLPDLSSPSTLAADSSHNCSTSQTRCYNYILRDCWLTVSKDLMVLLSNVAGKLDLQTLPDDTISNLLNSIIHTLLCPCSMKLVQNLATVHNGPSRKFMALEILCKLSVSELNMDYILATLTLNQLEELIASLIEMLMGKEPEGTVLKECALVLLLNLGLGEQSGSVFNLISHTPYSVSSIIEFMEEIECNASRIIHNQGFPALRDNPELMGTTLSMLRRSANLLLNLAYKTDHKPLFFRYQNRLLNLVMSQILDQNVANIIADILYILSLHQTEKKD